MNEAPSDTGFLSEHPSRSGFESIVARVVATVGVIGLGTAIGALLVAADAAGWVTGLVVSLLCVTLCAVLWRSRRL